MCLLEMNHRIDINEWFLFFFPKVIPIIVVKPCCWILLFCVHSLTCDSTLLRLRGIPHVWRKNGCAKTTLFVYFESYSTFHWYVQFRNIMFDASWIIIIGSKIHFANYCRQSSWTWTICCYLLKGVQFMPKSFSSGTLTVFGKRLYFGICAKLSGFFHTQSFNRRMFRRVELLKYAFLATDGNVRQAIFSTYRSQFLIFEFFYHVDISW